MLYIIFLAFIFANFPSSSATFQTFIFIRRLVPPKLKNLYFTDLSKICIAILYIFIQLGFFPLSSFRHCV